MTKVAFLVSKDPKTEHGGDVELARVVLRLAAESFDIRAICLSDEPSGDTTVDVVKGGLRLERIVQHPVNKVGLLTGAVRHRRSLVHVRFDTDELVEAIEAGDDDVFFCEHNYMAESFIRSAHFGKKGFVVNTINGSHTDSRTTMVRHCALGPCPPGNGTFVTNSTNLVTNIQQCNGSDNDAAHPIRCDVTVINNIAATTPDNANPAENAPSATSSPTPAAAAGTSAIKNLR